MGRQDTRSKLVNGEIWSMNDLTVIMTTANKVPKKWAEYYKGMLLEAIGDTFLITISFEHMDYGSNLIQTEYSIPNLFRQMLRAAKLAKTPYIAIAEDDMLYPKEHFEHRPPMDKIGYDLNRWILRTWGEPVYMHKPNMANSGMIAPRELFIEAVEERFSVDPTGYKKGLLKEIGRNDWEKYNNLTRYKTDLFYAKKPFVGFNHDWSIDKGQRMHKKKDLPVQAYDIPVWGRAENLVRRFK